jgi:hypothetical protein
MKGGRVEFIAPGSKSTQCATMDWVTLDEVNDDLASDEVV